MRRIIFIIIFLSVVWLPSSTCWSYTYAYRHYSHEIEWAVTDVDILQEGINIFDVGDDNVVIYKNTYFWPNQPPIYAIQINFFEGHITQIITDYGAEVGEIEDKGIWDPEVFDAINDYALWYSPELFSEVRILSDETDPSKQLTRMEELGKNLFFDKISSPDSMSCADCHAPSTGFTGPIAGINKFGAVYRGAVPTRFGNRKPPSAAYATLSPIFYYDEEEGLFIGGNFWDGRATGEGLGNPAADQALGPFLNPVEQNNDDKQAVLEQVATSKYASLWEAVWGEPISYETEEDIEKNYDRIGLAIAAYEASSEVNQFSSKYDLYIAGEVELTDQEAWGLELFNDPEKGNCAACHPSEPDFAISQKALFTDFSFDNLGVPKNPYNPVYDTTPTFEDPGLGGFLATRKEWQALATHNLGKHKVPTLRNVAKAPGKKFPKAYMHNGVFKSLKEVVHFYNTRDVEDWPAPEVADNVNEDELGNLELTDEQEDAIVAFMETLSDGYIPHPAHPAHPTHPTHH